MNNDELRGVFDRMATGYDSKVARLAPINNGLYFLLESVFAELPCDAHILCVGVGTGTELIQLAEAFPGWHFTGLEPSGAMLDVCRQRIEAAGLASRCSLHEGYLETLPSGSMHDGATCFLVSQFILDGAMRSDFFRQIADRLVPGGILVNSDLSADTRADDYDELLGVWRDVMGTTDTGAEGLSRMKDAYTKDVAVLPPTEVASIIKSGGFEAPIQFFQAGLIHAWFAHRAARSG